MTISLGLIVAVVGALVLMYNNLVAKKNDVENIFGTMDVMLKKRYDLIPNLIETVKQEMEYEKSTLVEITKLRAQATDDTLDNNEKVALENQIAGKMKSLMIAVENYPNLKASEGFKTLQWNWSETEAQIAASRRAYNASVTMYNNALEMFPTNMMAKRLKYERKNVLVIPEEERKNISAKDLFNA